MTRIVRELGLVVALFVALATIAAPSHCLRLLPTGLATLDVAHCAPSGAQAGHGKHAPEHAAAATCVVCQGVAQAVLEPPVTFPVPRLEPSPGTPETPRVTTAPGPPSRWHEATGPPIG